MRAKTTILGDAGRVADARAQARRRHPASRSRRKPKRPPAPVQFYGLAIIIAVLTLLGLVMVLSASSVMALANDGSGWVYFKRQLLWTGLGSVALLVTLRVPYHRWRRLVPVALVVSFALMVLVLFPSIGREVNGARARIDFGPFAVQPAELMKLALLLYGADLLARRADRMGEFAATLKPLLVVLSAAGVLIMLQPDLGSGLVLGAIVLGIAFVAGAPLVPLTATTGAIAAAGAFFVMRASYRRERWLAFLDLASHRQDSGFQVWQSLVGIASGGVTGVGIGESKAKWGFLPEAHTDFIFAIVAEELGLVGALAVCGLFVAFSLFGVQVALRAPDRFGMLLAGGITAWFLAQAVINIGGVIGMMPLTGLTLPFVSFGGSSLLVSMAAGGLLLNVARSGR